MCGISGIIGNISQKEGERLLEKMLASIEHRGPDSKGVWTCDGFAFGMRRLSIIDLPGGDQPIWSEEGVGIVFNGEIYNFKSLREGLEESDVSFKTNSDTEVILKLYLERGIEAIHELEGMFAICLYDTRSKKVYLVRDRLGIKPLYYQVDQDTFNFSSEIKSIIGVSDNKEVDQSSVDHYLTLRYVPAPQTIWKGIKKLEPGCCLTYDLEKSSFEIEKYWSVDFCSDKFSSTREYEREFEDLFLGAVEKRLLASDVPVGILLSGGLDSSCVAAAAVELGHKNFHTFSVGFEDGGEFSELNYARKVAEYIGSNHHEIVISKDQFIDFIDEFVWYADEPLADLASIPLYYVSKLASEHVKVVLSGEGADEILAGYDLDQMAKKLSILKFADHLPNKLLKVLPHQALKKLANQGYSNYFKQDPPHITKVFSESEKEKILVNASKGQTQSYLQELYNKSSSSEPLDQLQQAYMESWLVEDLLMKADKMSMANSLELRVPFLDHKLVEWASKLPLFWKTGRGKDGFTTKKILRGFAQKRIPEEIITRPKQGFPVPAYKWLAEGKINGLLKSSLEILELKGGIDKSSIESLLDKRCVENTEDQHKVWNLIIYATWIKKWLK